MEIKIPYINQCYYYGYCLYRNYHDKKKKQQEEEDDYNDNEYEYDQNEVVNVVVLLVVESALIFVGVVESAFIFSCFVK